MWSMAVWGGWVLTLFWSFFDFQRVKTLVRVVCLDERMDGWGGELFRQYPQRRGSCYKGALLSATWPAEKEPGRGQGTLFKTPRMEELHVKMNMKKSLALRLTNAQVFFLIREPIQHNLQEKMDIEIYLNLETSPKKKRVGTPQINHFNVYSEWNWEPPRTYDRDKLNQNYILNKLSENYHLDEFVARSRHIQRSLDLVQWS